MKAKDIRQGSIYEAKVSGKLTRVRVDRIESVVVPRYGWRALGNNGRRNSTQYHVTNLRTGRKTVFRSAAKFRREVQPNRPTVAVRAQQKAAMGIETRTVGTHDGCGGFVTYTSLPNAGILSCVRCGQSSHARWTHPITGERMNPLAPEYSPIPDVDYAGIEMRVAAAMIPTPAELALIDADTE